MADWEELIAPALRTYFRLTEEWGLSDQEQSSLLGEPEDANMVLWRQGAVEDVGSEALERISLLLGIYRALHTIFNDQNQANSWPMRNHLSGDWAGTTALAHMLSDGIPGLRRVHAHLLSQLD